MVFKIIYSEKGTTDCLKLKRQVMYRKNIEHIIMVSLKYFFDLDYSFYSHIILAALVAVSLLKFFLNQTAAFFHEGIITVKEDAISLKSEIAIIKENWEISPVREALINNIRSIRNMVPQKLS